MAAWNHSQLFCGVDLAKPDAHFWLAYEVMNMSKPWDKLRVPENPPIRPGAWTAKDSFGAVVRLDELETKSARLAFGSCALWFSIGGLRQLGEFCNELADQLEGE